MRRALLLIVPLWLVAGCGGIGGSLPPTAFDLNGEWQGVFSCLELEEFGEISVSIGGGSWSAEFEDSFTELTGTMNGSIDGHGNFSGSFTFDGDQPRTVTGVVAQQGEDPHLALGQFSMVMPDKSEMFLAIWIQRRI